MWTLTIPKLLRPYWLHTARQGSRCASVARAAMGRPRQPSPSRAAWPPLSGRLLTTPDRKDGEGLGYSILKVSGT